MMDTFVSHKNHPGGRSECPSLTQFSQESTFGDIRKYVESSVELSTIDSHNYEIHIRNKKHQKYVMLEQKYLDEFKSFQCSNIVRHEQLLGSSVESHIESYVELEVIWSIKKNNNPVASEQILYHNEQEPVDILSSTNLQMPSYEAEHFSNRAQAPSISETIDSTQASNNDVCSPDTNYGTSSIVSDTHKQDSIPGSTINIDPKNSIDALVVSSTNEKISSEQCSDVPYTPAESKNPVYSNIGDVYPVSKYPGTTIYDTNIEINTPLSSSNVHLINSKLNICQVSYTTTDENSDTKTKISISSDEDFSTKPCFTETDCPEIYRTAHKGPEVGRGSYGIVSSYVTKTGEMIAVKEIKLDEDDSEQVNGNFKWVQEVYILRKLKHPYIVEFYGISIENRRLVKVFMEYLLRGTIADMLVFSGPFPNNVLQKCTRQIVDGVAYLHENRIVHRDIKGKNVMLDALFNIRLIDFGCAIRLKENSNTNSVYPIFESMKGTLNWMAPEVVAEKGHGEKADIWSIGCTLCEMATGKPPWSSEDNYWAVLFIIAQGTKPPTDLPERCPLAAQEFFRLCLERDQTLRPSASDLQSHAFCRGESTDMLYP